MLPVDTAPSFSCSLCVPISPSPSLTALPRPALGKPADFELHKADLDVGIDALTAKLQGYETVVGQTKGACDHLLEEQDSLQMATASLRVGLDQTSHEMRLAFDDSRLQLAKQLAELRVEASASSTHSQV